MVEIAPVQGTAELAAIRILFQEYAESLEMDLEYQGFTAELADLPGSYAPPHGALLLARVDQALSGCVAVRRLHEQVCEMKRLYVRPAHRGLGVGPLLVRAAIESARGLGYAQMWLDTLPSMTAAHQLYRRLGFHEIAPYGQAFAHGSRFFGLRLAASPTAGGIS